MRLSQLDILSIRLQVCPLWLLLAPFQHESLLHSTISDAETSSEAANSLSRVLPEYKRAVKRLTSRKSGAPNKRF